MADSSERSVHTVGSVDDVTESSPLVTEIGETEIAVFYDGTDYFALNNVCPHQGGPLGDGKVEDACVYCPWHGWQFDLETGEHVHGKKQAETYRVKIDGSDVQVVL